MSDFFPAKLARAPRFCNRVEEQAKLKRNIELKRPTVLVSPRRYGKSSLAHKVVHDLKLPAAFIDLFLANDDKTVAVRILEGVGSVVSQIMPKPQKALELLQEYFSHFNFSFAVKGMGMEIAFQAKDPQNFDAAAQVHAALKSLSQLAAKENKSVVIFIDEFQDISNAKNSKTIEGAIRNVAQESNNIAFIFSGSSRHLLLNLFDDKNKPLYMLCDKIMLERMNSKDYHAYIQKAAKEKWGKALPEDVFKQMMVLTELHPFYVNMLGNELWQLNKIPANKAIVDQAWENCFIQEQRRLVAELEHLTINQQKVLKYLACNPVIEVYAQAVLSEVGLSNASMNLALKFLLENDIVHRIAFEDATLPSLRLKQHRILDPLLAYALRNKF